MSFPGWSDQTFDLNQRPYPTGSGYDLPVPSIARYADLDYVTVDTLPAIIGSDVEGAVVIVSNENIFRAIEAEIHIGSSYFVALIDTITSPPCMVLPFTVNAVNNVPAAPTLLTWNEPVSVHGFPEDIFEYHGEIDRSEGIGFVPLFVGLGTRQYLLDLTPFAGRQIGIRITAAHGGCIPAQSEIYFEVGPVPSDPTFNQILCPDVTVAAEILEGEVVAFSDIGCPDTMELTSEDEC